MSGVLCCCWRKTELDGVLGERWGGRSEGSCGDDGQAGVDVEDAEDGASGSYMASLPVVRDLGGKRPNLRI